MASIYQEPHCPACNNPYVSETGEWRICRDCPFRSPDNVSPENNEPKVDPNKNSDRSGDHPIMVLVKLSDLLELRAQRDDALSENAEMLFRTIDHEG
uniref:hypothetical protein n=1 Tax=Pararhizobium sp. IMCC3301 TaxID=3067904 RepID=UPI002740A630|nr:hypothetical protein [Pararhizobium sp. IMCC3301]